MRQRILPSKAIYVTKSLTDLDDLQAAKRRLEYPSLTARISALLGKPIEIGLKLLPGNWHKKVREITQAALLKGLQFAILTIGNKGGKSQMIGCTRH